MIPCITKAMLRQRAMKESKYIVQNCKQSDGVPAWMQKKADDYRTAIQRNINQKGRSILRVYSKIRKLYALMREANEKESDLVDVNHIQIEVCDKKIDAKTDKIAELQEALAECHKGKPAPTGYTMRGMHITIGKLNEEIKEIENEKGTLISKVKSRSAHDALVEKYKKKVTALESRFTAKINSLHSKNESVRIAYDEQFSYYWEKLQQYIELHVQKRAVDNSFRLHRFPTEIKDIAEAGIWKSEKLFENERRFINETVNPEFHNYYDV